MSTDGGLLRFRTRSGTLILPERPVRAAIAGLGLYETRWWRQRMLVRAGRLCLRMSLCGALRTVNWPAAVNVEWWRHWMAEVANPEVGPIGSLAMILLGDRQAVLLMDRQGRSLAFAKVWPGREAQGGLEQEAAILRAFDQNPPVNFRTPRILAHGRVDDHVYQLFTAIPDGPQRHPSPDPGLIGSVVDELQAKLAGLPDRPRSSCHHVMGHGDFSPRNLRLAADGNLWLFDWEYAGWTPRLADELRYWVTWYAARIRPKVDRDSARILSLLRARGTDEEIFEAVCWPEHNLPVEQALRDAVRAKVDPRAEGSAQHR